MGAIKESYDFIDVICQFTSKGEVIPMRIRIKDADGMFQTYNVKAYKEVSNPGEYNSPYGTLVHSYNWTFDCKIQVMNEIKQIRLFYNIRENLWKLC